MLMVVFTVLIALWLLGTTSAFTLGGAIHVLLLLAVLVLLIRGVDGRTI